MNNPYDKESEFSKHYKASAYGYQAVHTRGTYKVTINWLPVIIVLIVLVPIAYYIFTH
jgi:hypothetical protein